MLFDGIATIGKQNFVLQHNTPWGLISIICLCNGDDHAQARYTVRRSVCLKELIASYVVI